VAGCPLSPNSTGSDSQAIDDASPQGIWSGYFLPITVANLTMVAIAAFDGLGVVVALPSIAKDLGQIALLPWVITTYLGASSIAVIVSGPIVDAVGLRRTFRFASVWFLFSTVVVTVAPTMRLLLVARALQGIGGGVVIAVVLAGIGLTYPHKLRPKAFAANSAVWGLMGFGGPAVAGLLLTFAGWRFIYAAQIPLTLLAIAVGWKRVPTTRERPRRIAIDVVGLGWLSVIAFGSLISMGQLVTRPVVAAVGTLLIAVAGWAYWRHSRGRKEPILDLRHITRHPLGMIHTAVALIFAAGLAADNFLPLYLQISRGYSPASAAFAVIFLAMGWTLAAQIFARVLPGWPEANVMRLGATISIPALTGAAVSIGYEVPLPITFIAYFFIGLSIGFISTSGITLLQNSIELEEMGRASSAHQFVRSIGITYGVGMGGAVLLVVVGAQLGDVEVIRNVLDGQAVGVEAKAAGAAVRDGLVAVIAASVLLAGGSLIATLRLGRAAKSPNKQAINT